MMAKLKWYIRKRRFLKKILSLMFMYFCLNIHVSKLDFAILIHHFHYFDASFWLFPESVSCSYFQVMCHCMNIWVMYETVHYLSNRNAFFCADQMLLFGAFSLSLGKVLIIPTKTASEEEGSMLGLGEISLQIYRCCIYCSFWFQRFLIFSDIFNMYNLDCCDALTRFCWINAYDNLRRSKA